MEQNIVKNWIQIGIYRDVEKHYNLIDVHEFEKRIIMWKPTH